MSPRSTTLRIVKPEGSTSKDERAIVSSDGRLLYELRCVERHTFTGDGFELIRVPARLLAGFKSLSMTRNDVKVHCRDIFTSDHYGEGCVFNSFGSQGHSRLLAVDVAARLAIKILNIRRPSGAPKSKCALCSDRKVSLKPPAGPTYQWRSLGTRHSYISTEMGPLVVNFGSARQHRHHRDRTLLQRWRANGDDG